MGEGRVLQLLGPSTGGIRRHVAALRDGLVARGWEVVVAGPKGVLDDLGGTDAVVGVPAGLDPVATVRAARELRPLLDGADLVHAHGWKAAGVVAAIAAVARQRPPLVLTVHNTALPGSGPLARAVERVLPGRADAVITTSVALGEALSPRVRPDRLHVILPVSTPVAPDRSVAEVRSGLGVPLGGPLVAGAGRLHRQKGWPTLLDAAARWRSSRPDIRVVLQGTGPMEGELRQRIGVLGLADTVELVARTDGVADLLAAADVVVVPSVWESGPLVAAEALALGRPVVATPVGFVPALIDDGVTGRIVPIGDAAALAAAVARVLDDPVTAQAMGRAGAARVAEVLDPDVLVDAVEAVYRATRRSP
jgi:glycosyltransferase involved in cell wall biosynthesis